MKRLYIFFLSVLLLPNALLAQYIFSGSVSGETGVVPGATVRILETDYATVTDENGDFTLKDIPAGVYKIETRFVGHKTRLSELSISDDVESFDIVLTESLLTIDELVVTGTMNPTFVSQSPVKIEVVTSDYLNTYLPTAASSIVEGISLVNGVQEVVACGVCFTNSISINGLPGPYTAILMDGSPIYGNLAAVYGLNGIPSTIIDRFEVIKGPSSTLYGSEAVAGVINIITKDPANQPAISVDVMGTSHLESFANISMAPRLGKSKGFIGVNHAYMMGFDDENEDGFNDNINMDRLSLFTKWDIHRKSGKRFDLAAKYYYEDRRNGVEEFLKDRNYQQLRGSDQIYGESIYTRRAEVFGIFELPVLSNTKLNYSLSTHDQDSYYGEANYQASQQILFTNLTWNNRFNKHDILAGITNRYQVYDDNTVATQARFENGAQRQYIPGIFIQDEWELNPHLTVLGGARLDHYEAHDFIFSPRLNIKAKPGEWTTFRTNFGTGFRVVNLFTEDHAFVTGQREVVIAEELLPEESYNLSFNLNHVYTFGNAQGMFDLDVFYTYFSNKITPNYEVQNQILYENTNGYATSKGVGINVQHQFDFPLSFNIGFNIQDVSEMENGTKRAIEFSPASSGVFTMNYKLKKSKWSFSYTGRYTGPMQLPTVYDLNDEGNILSDSRPTISNSFSIHNIQVSKDLNKGLGIYFGVQNMLDYIQPWSPLTGYNDPNSSPGFSDNFDTAYAYSPIHGREIYLGVKWSLPSKK